MERSAIKKYLIIFLIFNSSIIFSQTWVVDGSEVGVPDFDYEYTVITKVQFDRILRSNEQTSVAVMLNYLDNSQAFDEKTGG